jgi:hypothetical protein
MKPIPFKRFAVQADRMFAEIVVGEALKSAEVIVDALQQSGPQWSGEFSNSWKIETRTQVSRGKGQKTLPIVLKAPKPRGRDVLRGNTWFVRIENTAPYAAVAMDLEEGKFSRKWYPKGPVARGSKWDQTGKGRRIGPTIPPMKRGVTNYGEGGSASRTAPLDWFSTFKKGGKINEIMKKYVGKTVNLPEQYSFLNSPTYRTRSVSD